MIKKIIVVFVCSFLFTLTGCKKEKHYNENTITVKTIFGDETINITCKSEIVPSADTAIFFYSNETYSTLKGMVNGTVFDSKNGITIYNVDGKYFALNDKDEDDQYLLTYDKCKILGNETNEFYIIPFPSIITKTAHISTAFSINSKQYLLDYYNGLDSSDVSIYDDKIVINNINSPKNVSFEIVFDDKISFNVVEKIND